MKSHRWLEIVQSKTSDGIYARVRVKWWALPIVAAWVMKENLRAWWAGLALVALLVAGLARADSIPSPTPDASPTRRGLVSTGAQAFSGLKTFDGGVVADVRSPPRGFINLFVDGTAGSDANECRAVGSACRTIQAAVDRVPKRLSGSIATIYVDAGVYNERVYLSGFRLSEAPDGGSSGVQQLTVAGTLVAPSLSGGTVSGTVTSYAAQSGSTPPTMTDATQSWLDGGLNGHFLRIGTGTSYAPIVSNTATTVSTAFAQSAAGGNPYDIWRPGTVIDGGVVITGNVGENSLQLQDVHVASTGAGNAAAAIRACQGFSTFRRVKLTSGTGSAISATDVANVVVSASHLQPSTAASGCGVSMSNVDVTSLQAYYSASAGGGVCLAGKTTVTGYYEAASTGAIGVIEFNSGLLHSSQAANLIVRCLTPGTGIGVEISHPADAIQGPVGTWASAGGPNVRDCGSGLLVYAPVYAAVSSPTMTSVGTAFLVDYGGTINFRYSTPTFSGVTTELSLDPARGAPVNFPFTDLSAAPSASISSPITHSSFQSR